jgi:hypothetical protein
LYIRARPPGRFTSHDGLSLWYKVSGCGPVLLVPTPGWDPSSDQYMKSLIRLEKNYTLIYCLLRSEANQLHCGIKGSTLFTIKSTGHFPWVERPTAFFRDFDRAARKNF